ncbi:hypothetical protein P170DRAFT_273445 [Aspergillus steynii IBT 23096]|uniref:Uncharacterized protein n=1 Tax=Aspergillus steynii IBT 23096 TaxID=1392250 RepID=A0A2I2FX42_9EURO|nr:uncharacterized protein P170DRAFT_273445 [Aspergillus steynii IBT 23096]PLB45136.1 hypothetical protein P170DRAFT_273445 [Aspergillus steynii IBT 23096]
MTTTCWMTLQGETKKTEEKRGEREGQRRISNPVLGPGPDGLKSLGQGRSPFLFVEPEPFLFPFLFFFIWLFEDVVGLYHFSFLFFPCHFFLSLNPSPKERRVSWHHVESGFTASNFPSSLSSPGLFYFFPFNLSTCDQSNERTSQPGLVSFLASPLQARMQEDQKREGGGWGREISNESIPLDPLFLFTTKGMRWRSLKIKIKIKTIRPHGFGFWLLCLSLPPLRSSQLPSLSLSLSLRFSLWLPGDSRLEHTPLLEDLDALSGQLIFIFFIFFFFPGFFGPPGFDYSRGFVSSCLGLDSA